MNQENRKLYLAGKTVRIIAGPMAGTAGAVRLTQLICVLEHAAGYAMEKFPQCSPDDRNIRRKGGFQGKTGEIHIARTG